MHLSVSIPYEFIYTKKTDILQNKKKNKRENIKYKKI